MDKETRVIGIEVETLKEIIHGLVHEELSKMADHIIAALRPSKTDLVEGREYTTKTDSPFGSVLILLPGQDSVLSDWHQDTALRLGP
jgi:hypothetical protein